MAYQMYQDIIQQITKCATIKITRKLVDNINIEKIINYQ